MKCCYELLIAVGNALTVVGCAGLMLALSGLMHADLFDMGISSGVRIIGSVAIMGCLLSAVGYGIVDYLEK
jgi:uncharacterized membrane protein